MANSCSVSSVKQYEIYLRKWVTFCIAKNIVNPSVVEISDVLSFLYSVFESGVSYSGCNTARSALSLVLKPIDNFTVGCHPLVVRILKAIGRKNPPKARYESVWDAGLVLKLFSSWLENKQLSLKDLSLKLVALLALTTAQRVQTLCAIKLSNIKGESTKEIFISSTLKTSKLSKPQPCLLLSTYKKNPKLCVVSCLKEYINRTSSLRLSLIHI